jgi:hypothetical protein
MPGIKVYPGIAPGSCEFFYKDVRVQLVPMGLPLDETVHSVYECSELSDEKGIFVKCPFILTIKDVVQVRISNTCV